MSDALLTCSGLRVGYREPILPPIDVRIGPGELWAVVGRNGVGKTTWFRTVLGLVPSIAGAVQRSAALRLSYVPQSTRLDPLFPLLARDVVRMGIDRDLSFAALHLREPDCVEECLRVANVIDLADRPFHTLSEGQKQRVLLARLAASCPELALLDEPTAAMDFVAERESFEWLSKLRDDRQTAILVVSHTLGTVREFADRVLFLDRSTIVVGTADEVLSHEAFERSYGQHRETRHHG